MLNSALTSICFFKLIFEISLHDKNFSGILGGQVKHKYNEFPGFPGPLYVKYFGET